MRVLVLRELQRALVGRDGVVEELLLCVQRAQLEVGLRERALHRQARVGQIGGRALLAGPLRADRTAYRAPQIRFPRRIERRGRSYCSTPPLVNCVLFDLLPVPERELTPMSLCVGKYAARASETSARDCL